MGWSERDIPDLTGKVAVVTGASAGLGLACTEALARRGAEVVLATRDAAKTSAAVATIRRRVPDARVEHVALDLASLASVADAAATLRARYRRLDVVLCNAGLMATPLHHTEDGFELQLGVNHLGHAALVAQLLGPVRAAAGSRIVVVSSALHAGGRIRFDDPMFTQGYQRWEAYGQSKLANLLYVRELQRRLAAAGADTLAVGAHPGYARTELQTKGPTMQGGLSGAVNRAVNTVGNVVLAQPAHRGALPLLYAATAPGVEGGGYYGPRGPGGWRGAPARARPSRAARDDDAARRLWELTEQLVGVTHGLPAA